MLTLFRRSLNLTSPSCVRRGFPIVQPVAVRAFARYSNDGNKSKKEKEPIIVEIIDNTGKFKEKKAEKEAVEEKKPSFSLFDSVQKKAQSVVSHISNSFFPDEETRIKNEMKNKVNEKIDAAFTGNRGLLGSIIKQGVKMVSGRVVSHLVDVERMQRKLEVEIDGILSRDPQTKRALGLPIEVVGVVSMQSVMVEDGRKRRSCEAVTYQIIGSRGSGLVTAVVDTSGDGLAVQRVQVTVDQSREVFDVPLTAKPDKDHIIDL